MLGIARAVVTRVFAILSGSFSGKIAVGADDARNAVDDGTTISLGPGGNEIGFRFVTTIPQGVTIGAGATLTLTSSASQSAAITMTIWGEDVDDPADFSARSVPTANRTTASVEWVVPTWSVDENGPDTTSPSITSIIQELVDRPGFSGTLVLTMDRTADSGGRTAHTYDGDPTKAAQLDVSWT